MKVSSVEDLKRLYLTLFDKLEDYTFQLNKIDHQFKMPEEKFQLNVRKRLNSS